MNQTDQALRVALGAVQQLPRRLKIELTERLIAATVTEESIVFVCLHRLSAQKQARLAKLMDKNSESRLNRAEQLELKQLGSEVDDILLGNSQALARALRPELFDEHGQPPKGRFQQALGAPASKRASPRRRSTRT